jgi:flagellar motor switch protein FliN
MSAVITKPNFLSKWQQVASQFFEQALAGAPKLLDTLPRPASGAMAAFTAILEGDLAGSFTMQIEESVFDVPLLGEGMDQKTAWSDLLHECAEAATGAIEQETGAVSHVVRFENTMPEGCVSLALNLKSETGCWLVLLLDKVRPKKVEESAAVAQEAAPQSGTAARRREDEPHEREKPVAARPEAGDGDIRSRDRRNLPLIDLPLRAEGVDLLLDVEMEASLRFGTRELPLGEILNLGPGDVVELDRQIADPVDLIVGDRIVARGEVVLVNGNFGLKVTEVAEPRKRLETIRCLF